MFKWSKKSEQEKKGIDLRKEQRINVRLTAIITNKKKSFITYTKNISRSGLLLESRIPEYILNSECEIYLIGPQIKESIIINCVPVGSEKNPARLQFKEISEKNLAILDHWIFGITQSRLIS